MSRTLEEEWAERNRRAEEGGGVARQARQERLGRWTARQRIAALVDEGTFFEVGKHVKHDRAHANESLAANRHPGDGIICGTAQVRGRAVAVIAHDPTVLRGALGLAGAKKMIRLLELAEARSLPVLTLADGDGARIAEGIDSIEAYGSVLTKLVDLQARVSQFTLVSGLCVGGAAYAAALTDWVAMVAGQSYMFITGAKVTRVVMGEETNMDDLGGPEMHAKLTGQCCAVLENEERGIEWLKRLTGYLDLVVPSGDDPHREVPRVGTLIPVDQRKPYDVRQVIDEIFDRDSVLELSPKFGASLLTVLARLGGRTVAVLASQPMSNAGCLDIDASRKGTHFIDWAARQGFPILTLVDVPGYLPGKRQEQGGIVPIGATLIRAYGQAKNVPQLCLILRKCYGGATVLSFSSRIKLALPTARIAPMGADATLEVVFGALPTDASDAEKSLHEERRRAWLEENDHAWAAAEQGYVDDVIQPSRARSALYQGLENLLHEK